MNMDQPLDLSITLVAPPADSSPETIASIELRCDQLGLQYRGDLLTDPLTARERENLRWYLEEYAEWPYEQFLERGKKIEGFLAELGKRLYQGIFGSVGAMGIVQPWRLQPLQPDTQRQISIISELSKALSLPWELLHDAQGFLVLRSRHPVSLIRRLPQGELPALSMPFEPPLHILLITARPDNTGFTDPRSIAHELLDEVQPQIDAGSIALEFLRPPTLSALRTRLSDPAKPPIHVLHFDGHGIFGEEHNGQRQQHLSIRKQGMLAFEDDEGKLDLVEAERLAQVMQDSGVKLAVLAACQSAVSGSDDAFSSVAAQLIRSGLDAVSAMSASVLTISATRYAEAFYRSLVSSRSVSLAQERARQALHDDPRRDIHRRRKDDEGTTVTLREWWLPHYYQQRPVLLQQQSTRKRKKISMPPPLQRLSEGMPPQPRYGFSGRAHELLQIERYLLQGKVVVLHGFGGIGKTALACEAADWLTRTQMYERACFVSFEHGGDAPMLLSALSNSLDMFDEGHHPNNVQVAMAQLIPALKNKRILLIADNLESILSNGETPLDRVALGQLWDVFLALASSGAGVLLTSRDTAFGDGHLTPGDKVMHLPLNGLHPDDAYALASRLLANLGIDRAHLPYAGLRDLLGQLDYHPLAIQLVLPMLRERSLATIRAEFSELLPHFVDDTETGRNHSLLASLGYSLRRLSEEQQALLSRLAPFEGGACEDNLLVITEISEQAWATLRPILEQTALVTLEPVLDAAHILFLHFHPVLVPYLRSQPGADNAALYKLYTLRYYALSANLYDEDRQYPLKSRAIARCELPNLRRAVNLLMQEGQIDAALDMAHSIAHFLSVFGLTWEYETLLGQVSEAATARGSANGLLTNAEWIRETSIGERELRKGNLSTASTYFTSLLARIEAQPEGTQLGRGSFEHCSVFQSLARCLENSGQLAAAEEKYREALAIIEKLLKLQPDSHNYIGQRASLLKDMGRVLLAQGQYARAQSYYKEAVKAYTQIKDVAAQAMMLGELGTLALLQRNYVEARLRYTDALNRYHILSDLPSEGILWYQLGRIAQEQNEWTEAVRCYRKSLRIDEQLGNTVDAATTCHQLGMVARQAGHLSESEGWYRGALERVERVDTGNSLYATCLSNLADVLVDEVQAGIISRERLREALCYAEQALTIKEGMDASKNNWSTLSVLAKIADLEGQAEAARIYRHRARENFAAFAGNRDYIDRNLGKLIVDFAAGARGNLQAQVEAEPYLSWLEEQGWHVTSAVRHIWTGEREWHSLVEDLRNAEALLILRILETLQTQQEQETI